MFYQTPRKLHLVDLHIRCYHGGIFLNIEMEFNDRVSADTKHVDEERRHSSVAIQFVLI